MSCTPDITDRLRERAGRLHDAEVIADILEMPFILAGGAMRSAEPRDYDIFGFDKPIDLAKVEYRCRGRTDTSFIVRTDNAVTMMRRGQVIQFCKHFKPTAFALVDSFDFTHIQAGVVFDGDGEIVNFAYTKAFENVELYSDIPTYTGSEYPLSSLARLVKFEKRGDFGSADDIHFLAQILVIFRDIVKRGFTDEDDFESQCAAISASFGCVAPEELYELLKKGGAK